MEIRRNNDDEVVDGDYDGEDDQMTEGREKTCVKWNVPSYIWTRKQGNYNQINTTNLTKKSVCACVCVV